MKTNLLSNFKRVRILGVCLAACVLSCIFLYRFYNPPVSGLTDVEAKCYGFSSAERVVELFRYSDWRNDPNRRLVLLDRTFAQGKPFECVTGVGSMAQIRDKEVERRAITLLKKYPLFWSNSKSSLYQGGIKLTLTSFIYAGNRDIVEELLHDLNPRVRELAATSLEEAARFKKKGT